MIQWRSTRCDLCGKTGSNYEFRSGFEFMEYTDSSGTTIRIHEKCRYAVMSAFYENFDKSIADFAMQKLGLKL